eukprot:scaffold23753_cov81-Skeletonema_menzelii.AAC.1
MACTSAGKLHGANTLKALSMLPSSTTRSFSLITLQRHPGAEEEEIYFFPLYLGVILLPTYPFELEALQRPCEP